MTERTLDLSKLSPAPWQAGLDMPQVANNDPRSNIVWHGSQHVLTVFSQWVSDDVNCANAAFIALARNAFDGDPESLAWWEANRNRRSDAAT